MTDQLPGQLPLLPKRKPMVNGDLVDAAAALCLCQHDSPLVTRHLASSLDEENAFIIEGDLAAARTAASAYLVACFEYATTAFEGDDE